jgi:ArsR family transcriptional regulator
MGEPDLSLCEEVCVHTETAARALQKLPEDDILIDLAELYKIFGDSTRIKILYLLVEEDLCVCDIAAALNRTLSAISHQLRV